jgi:hypothetical protein
VSTALATMANGPMGSTPARVQLGGAAAMQQTIEDLNTIRAFVANEMTDGLDFGVIPGTGGKPTLLQPGAQKIFMYFNCFAEHDVDTHELDGGHVEYIVKTRLLSRTSQAQIGAGLGSCSTMESKYRWRNASRKCPRCGAEAIIKGKEEYGGGWVCFKKKNGCGANFNDNDPAITGQAAGRAENPDIYDQRNTVLKMAKKRSQVDAAHGLGCMSELFTQDLDDFHDVAPAPEGREPERPDDRRREVNAAFTQRQGGNDEAPRSGKALFAWVKEQEQRHEIGLVKYLNGWAKLMEFPGRMVDWDAGQVNEAYTEACRKIRAIQEPKSPPPDEAPEPMPAKRDESWASFVAKACSERRDYWATELAIANVPQADRVRAENLLPDQGQVTNHFVSHAIKAGALKPEDVSKDGKADGPRDPSKGKAAMADLFQRAPKRLRAAVAAYFADKEREIRVRLGMDDLVDDTSGQDVAEEISQEPAGREPGEDG